MSGLAGKTVLRVEERPVSPEFGYARDDTLLIHFTDGTALSVVGSSWEEVSLGWSELSGDEVRGWARAAQGRREVERLERLQREELTSVSPEERARRRAVRRAKMSPFALAMEDATVALGRSFLADMNRQALPVGDQVVGFPDVQKRGRARRS